MKLKVLLVSIFLLPFIIISFCNQPAIDDYRNALAITQFGRMGAVRYFYDTVSGRFFSLFLMSFLNTLPSKSVFIFKLFPVIIILALSCSFFLFYTTLLGKHLDRTRISFLSLLSVGLHIVNMRWLFDGLYWMSSTVSYQMAIVISLIAVSLIMRSIRKSSFSYGVPAAFCCFILPGTTEITAAPFLIVLVCMLRYYKTAQAKKIIYASILSTMCGVGMVLISKGSALRIEHNSLIHHIGVIKAVFYSFRSVFYYSFLWLVTPSNLVSILMILLMLPDLEIGPKLQSVSAKVIYFILFVSICVVVYFPLFYYESSVPYPRVTTIEFFFAANLFLILLILIRKVHPVSIKVIAIKNNNKLMRLFNAVFFIALFSSHNFISVTKDLVDGTAFHFNKEANTRFIQLENCKTDTCQVSYFKYLPSSIMSFTHEPDDYIDKYFDKTVLYTK